MKSLALVTLFLGLLAGCATTSAVTPNHVREHPDHSDRAGPWDRQYSNAQPQNYQYQKPCH